MAVMQYGSQLKAPVFPGSTSQHHEFWNEFRKVVEVQLVRRRKADPAILNRWPDLWQEYGDLDDIAKLVQNEYPASLQQSYIGQLFRDGVEVNYDIMPFRSANDFVGTEVRIAAINTWAVDAVAPISFLLKWHTGMPRPEEMAWLIYSGLFTSQDGVPHDIISLIRSMNLQHAAEFTAYMGGSPLHPSWPAMHAAASSCSLWLPVIVKINAAQYCEALRMDYGVAYARTVAGVHYEMDNYAGLNLASLVLLEKFPAMLNENYGADLNKVRERLEYLRFDWYDFNPHNCTIAGVPVGDRL